MSQDPLDARVAAEPARPGPRTVGPDPEAELDLQRSALLRSVTHDLRTPLAAIRAIVSDLHAGTDYPEQTRQELLQTVCDEVDRLDRLVGNLLSMSRIDAGVLEPRHQAIDVSELVRHRLAVLEPLLRHVTVVADIDPGLPLVDGDYGQIEEVLTNLLANAARHAPDGTRVAVVARAVPVDIAAGRGFVTIAVVDHGPGFDPGARDRLFLPFSRGAGSRSTGLGLAICRAIVVAHGGTIAVEDTPGGGASVVFTLPEHRQVDAAADPPRRDDPVPGDQPPAVAGIGEDARP